MYGLHVHEAALAKGVKVSGATVHFVSEEVDGGPIIYQELYRLPTWIQLKQFKKEFLR